VRNSISAHPQEIRTRIVALSPREISPIETGEGNKDKLQSDQMLLKDERRGGPEQQAGKKTKALNRQSES
jgi:hypothetical protein